MARRRAADVEIERDVCGLAHEFTRSLDAHVRRVADLLGLTPTQVVALRELAEPITARQLATRMACEPSNVTFVLDRLEREGLARREPHPTDRRAKQIVLTADGKRRRDTVLEHLGTESPLSALSAADQRTFRDLLQTLVDARSTH
jgi:DNA-binding MarR family transcriptional regulator